VSFGRSVTISNRISCNRILIIYTCSTYLDMVGSFTTMLRVFHD
jgi:hypothetical protein